MECKSVDVRTGGGVWGIAFLFPRHALHHIALRWREQDSQHINEDIQMQSMSGYTRTVQSVDGCMGSMGWIGGGWMDDEMMNLDR